MRKRHIFAAAAATILLSGCSGSGLGMPGSPAWLLHHAKPEHL
ncbi:hypothetical protein [Mesorhizobium sp. M0778]